jgi:AraC-like DNA-binding protein
MDLLTYSIERMDIRGQVICKAIGSAPWGIKVSEDLHIPFYFMQAGSAWIQMSDTHVIRLNQGDLVFIPHGEAHVICDHLDNKVYALFQWEKKQSKSICPIRVWEGNGIEAQVLCGVYRLENSFFTEMLLNQLPQHILIATSDHKSRQIRPVLQLLLNELNLDAMGGHRIIMHVLELLLIKSLRIWIHQDHQDLGWINAARESAVSQAVATFFQRPEEQWTVASIADEVNMSRASFARDFLRVVAQPPLTFLTGLRMNLASRLLTIERETIASVCTQIGYRSEASFTRAFKKHFGSPPSRYRIQSNTSLSTPFIMNSDHLLKPPLS